jgi:hypothetical protein
LLDFAAEAVAARDHLSISETTNELPGIINAETNGKHTHSTAEMWLPGSLAMSSAAVAPLAKEDLDEVYSPSPATK